ncbi:hypothetical protein ACLBWS_05785 [Brucellaceae bacterium D45D]
MKMIRSLFFGCAAMLAAVLCMSAPASAVDYSPGVFQIHSVSHDYVVPDIFKTVATIPAKLDLPERSTNSHAVIYVCQNQPHSTFRRALEAYSHIDPHIKAS